MDLLLAPSHIFEHALMEGVLGYDPKNVMTLNWIAMIGVVGNEAYPATDITVDVTAGLIGTGGDYLLYTGQNYKQFMEHYLGASLNILPAQAMADMYYSEEYVNMKTFPEKDSIRIIDGVMYIKTENVDKNLVAQP
jgi:hypothetical protein